MTTTKLYDVIIIGGSYAGLSAAMALGRALRTVLIIDSGKPCNRQTPHSHNFITHDGDTPAAISTAAREQVLRYSTVELLNGIAVSGKGSNGDFQIDTDQGTSVRGKKLLFTSGLKDVFPDIPGFEACWGISVLHCPYCHGYEVRDEKTGIISNGEMAFEFGKLINNWTKDLTIFTNGPSTIKQEHISKLSAHHITIVEEEIASIEHDNGYVNEVRLKDDSSFPLKAMYARPAMIQHCGIAARLGCELTEQNLLKVDMMQRTTIPGVYAAGDSSIMMRSVALAVSTGGFAGASLNKDLIDEAF